MSIFGATDTPVLDFWWRLLSVSKPEWTTLFALGGRICDIHSLRYTSSATCEVLGRSLGVYTRQITFFWPAESPGYRQWQQESQ